MYRVGVDLGGTNIAVGVIDDDLKIIGRGKMKTNCPRAAELIMEDIAKAVFMACEDAGIELSQVASIGVGTPGSVNKEKGMIEYANNLDFDQVPAKELLCRYLGTSDIPVYLDNDANCAALGEAVAGCGKGVKNFVAITLGTGVGGGVIVDGHIVSGVNDAAGELGHMVINFDGEMCNCGRRGCWERYASATALVAQTKEAMKAHKDSVMWDLVEGDINAVNGRVAFDAMRKGDEVAKKVVFDYIYYVSVGVTNIINALQPEILCVGGGIGHEKEYLLVPLRRMVENDRYTIHAQRQTKIISAELGNDAGIYGAALLDC